MSDEGKFAYPSLQLYYPQTSNGSNTNTASQDSHSTSGGLSPHYLNSYEASASVGWTDGNYMMYQDFLYENSMLASPIQPQTQTMAEEQFHKAQNILFPNLTSLLVSSPASSPSTFKATLSPNAKSDANSASSSALYPNLSNLHDALGGADGASSLRWMKLTASQFHSLKDSEGRISETNKNIIRQKIFKGGIEEDIRPEIWKFLLNLFPFSASHLERQTLLEKRRREYMILKNQWTSILPEQEEHFFHFREQKRKIQADVLRTDRNISYYKDEKGDGLKKLNDILLSYIFFNFDLGYVQGMSDFLAPILFLIQDEAETFWCFKGLMDRLQHNFEKSMNGMKTQLTQLGELVKKTDPKLWEHFQNNQCSDLYFCFRWLLIHFKREFSFEQSMLLWECLWAADDPNYHLYIALACLQSIREDILTKQMSFDDILKFINDMAGQMSLSSLLTKAEELYTKNQKKK